MTFLTLFAPASVSRSQSKNVFEAICTIGHIEVENRPVRKNHCVSAEVAEILYPLYIGCTKL